MAVWPTDYLHSVASLPPPLPNRVAAVTAHSSSTSTLLLIPPLQPPKQTPQTTHQLAKTLGETSSKNRGTFPLSLPVVPLHKLGWCAAPTHPGRSAFRVPAVVSPRATHALRKKRQNLCLHRHTGNSTHSLCTWIIKIQIQVQIKVDQG